jgi:hypothetical protein
MRRREAIANGEADITIASLNFADYQADPVRFGMEVLGERYTDPIKEVMYSVRDHPVTIAISANATGKTHSAARIALWFYLCYPDAQVYTTAAPPERNLRKILWGEIGHLTSRRQDLFPESSVSSGMNIQRNSQSFITGIAIPSSGTPEQREAKFCADADDLFEMQNGLLIQYKYLIGRNDIPVISVNDKFERESEFAQAFDNGVREVYEITMDDGEIIRRTSNHPVYAGWDIRPDNHVYPTMGHKKGQIRAHQEGWQEVGNLNIGDAILGSESTDFNFGHNQIDDDLVKFLAYMIGDGSFIQKRESGNRLQFTQDRNRQLEEFTTVLKNLGAEFTVSDHEKYNWVCVSTHDKRLSDFSRECGLHGLGSEHKFVPNVVFSLRPRQVAIFLSRLFATDGWASMSNKAEIGYSSKSERLVRDVQRLLRRFGIRSKLTSKEINWTTHGADRSGHYWGLYISHSTDVIKFHANIGIYGKEESVDKCVEYATHTIWRHANWKFEHAGYVWRRIVSIRKIGSRPTVGMYVPKNHTYLTSLVEHNSGKHAPHLLFIVDEGDAVPPEVYRGIEACMSGGMTRLLIMFNPRADVGTVARMVKNREGHILHLSAFDHPNVITGNDEIPGAVSREKTVRRLNEWSRPLAAQEARDIECFEVPDFLVGHVAKSLGGEDYPPLPAGWRRVHNPALFYMVLGIYPPKTDSQLISRVWLDDAVTRWLAYTARYGETPPHTIKPIVGMDIADMGKDSNQMTLRYGGYVARQSGWSGIDPDATAIKAYGELKQMELPMQEIKIYVDATGVGAGVAPRMMRLGASLAEGVMVASSPTYKTEMGVFFQLRDQLWWSVMTWLRDDKGAMLPPDDDLLDELAAPSYAIRNGKIRVSDKDTMIELLGRSPDQAESLMMTFAPTSPDAGTFR